MQQNSQCLVKKTINGMRHSAEDNKWFRMQEKGAMKVVIVPECKEADDFAGGLSSFDEVDNGIGAISTIITDKVYYEYTFPIFPGGNPVSTSLKRPEAYQDHAAICSMKAAAVLDCGHLESGYIGVNAPNLVEQNGYANWPGGIGVIIHKGSSTWARIAIAVSGSDDYGDFMVAKSAVPIIESFFNEERTACFEFSVLGTDYSNINSREEFLAYFYE